MHTYRLTLEYDGTRYHGWQEQPNARTVAGELRRALEAAGARVVDLGGSGRTDAGVHALAQVVHVRLTQPIDPPRLRVRLNDALPADVHVLALVAAARGFHARHDAVLRSYLYQIGRRRSAFAKRYVWWVKTPIDVGRMAEAARRLAGRHDYAHFCDHHAGQTSTLVVVDEVTVAEAGDLVLVRLAASHFLWKMARRVVGVLVKIGAGELTLDGLTRLLAATPLGADEPAPARWTAPASGLFLERVTYPGEPAPGPLAPAFAVAAEGPFSDAPYVGANGGGRRPARKPGPRVRRARPGLPSGRRKR